MEASGEEQERSQTIPERIRESNRENLEYLGKKIGLPEHFSLNKTLIPFEKYKGFKKVLAFPKIENGVFQILFHLENENGQKAWFNFYILDANKSEKK